MNKKFILPLVIGVLILGMQNVAYAETTFENADEPIVTVDGNTITRQDLYDITYYSSGKQAMLDALDLKVLEPIYKDDVRVQEKKDEIYDNITKDRTKKDLADLYKRAGVTNIDDYFIKANGYLYIYNQLVVIDTSYEEIFTKKEIEYTYEHKISQDRDIYRILIEPVITGSDEESKTKDMQDALIKAEQVVKEINEGLSFSEAVTKYSFDKLTTDGLLGNFNVTSAREAGFETEVANVAFSLENETVSAPILTTLGYEIIMVKDTSEKPSFEDSKNEIAQILFDLYNAENTNTSAYALTLFRRNNNIVINNSNFFKSYANDVLNARIKFKQTKPSQNNGLGN